ncbi:metalloprotease tiki2 [Plakobranchus ocellatus]|uniref:Metalloprotease TIKI homolog n=1 Tax=Plakobranchus ocellatus TaxID=259542 RepID=A0AAV3ZMB4_9GAST|nr:metalloprotease tiki2 [Plakobranchus ocellatus]
MREANVRPECSSSALIQHYNCGDLNSLLFSRDTTQVPTLMNTSLLPHDLEKAELIERYFQEELIDKRNERMAQRVAYLIEQHSQTSFFFAFGAALRAHGLTVNPEIGQTRIVFLGHVVTNFSLLPLPIKVKKVLSFASPTTKKQLADKLGVDKYSRLERVQSRVDRETEQQEQRLKLERDERAAKRQAV